MWECKRGKTAAVQTRDTPFGSGINMREIHFPVATRARDTSADE